MADSDLTAVILAAGMGTRMKSALPKVLHRIAGRPMIQYVMASLEPLRPGRTVVVTGPGMDEVARAVASCVAGGYICLESRCTRAWLPRSQRAWSSILSCPLGD